MRRFPTLRASAALCLLAACSDDTSENTPDVAEDAAEDIATDGAEDVTPDVGEDTALDVAPDTTDVGPSEDAAVDATPDAVGPSTPFYLEEWPLPEREWSRCEDTEHATPGTLAERAAYYQWTIPRFFRAHATLEDGREITHALMHLVKLDGPVPDTIVDDAELPNVIDIQSWANAGLWSSHYVASQAFRYAVAAREGDPDAQADALEELRITLTGMYNIMRITGVPGLYGRSYHSPVPGVRFPDPGPDKHFVTEGEFADYVWTGDVSQDEYSGHMYVLGVVAKLVDEPDIQEIAQDIASQVGHHLRENSLHIIDADGEVTEHGRMNALSFTHFPGYNAWISLNWTQMPAEITQDDELVAFYRDCLLQESGEQRCLSHPVEQPVSYTSYFDSMDVLQGCETNFNSLSMLVMAAANIIWFEGDDDLRATYQQAMFEHIMTGDPGGRQPVDMANPFYNFIFAAFADWSTLEALDGAPTVEELVHDAVCTLREFEPTMGRRGTDTTYEPEVCTSEQHGSLAAEPFPWREREADIFKFWFGPYERRTTGPDAQTLVPPADFLLPYWMGRYFGFVPADL